MQLNATDQLKQRVLDLKKEWNESISYTDAVLAAMPELNELKGKEFSKVQNKIKAVWNLQVADEQITQILEAALEQQRKTAA